MGLILPSYSTCADVLTHPYTTIIHSLHTDYDRRHNRWTYTGATFTIIASVQGNKAIALGIFPLPRYILVKDVLHC